MLLTSAPPTTIQEWLLNLTQGSLAAAIGLIGAFGVFWATRRHERHRAEADERSRQRAALSQAILEINTAAAGLARDFSASPIIVGAQAISELLGAVYRFVQLARPLHPTIAEWAMMQCQVMTQAQGRYRQRWWLPVGRSSRIAAWAEPAGELGGRLLTWETNDLPETWFAEDLPRLRKALGIETA